MAGGDLWIAGASMLPVGRYPDLDVFDLAAQAALAALDDGGTRIHDVDLIAAGSLFERKLAQGVQKLIGQTGIPVYNVTNACATGATAVRVAVLAIKAGEANCCLVVGAEQMGKAGLLGPASREAAQPARFAPAGRAGAVRHLEGILGTALMPGVFAEAGIEYARTWGVSFGQIAMIAEKNHAHSALNPLAQYRRPYTAAQVMAAPMVSYPNTTLMCSPTGDCASALVIVSDERLRRLEPALRRRAVKISASVLTTDPYVDGAEIAPDVNTLTRQAAARAYDAAARSARKTSISWSCMTASPPPSYCTTRTSACARPGERRTSSSRARAGGTGPRQ